MRYLPALLFTFALTTLTFAQTVPPEQQRITQLLADGKEAEALEAARDWTLENPASPEALALYSRLQANADDVAGALDSLEAAYFLTRDVDFLVRKGQVYLDNGLVEQAQQQFREALRHKETYTPAHVGLALVMLEKREPLEAASVLNAALALDPTSLDAQIALARLQVSNGHYSEAEKQLRTALQTAPQSAEAHLWLGRIYSDTGRPAEAREQWRDYVKLQPGEATAWLLANNLYLARSQPFNCTGYYPTFSPNGKLLAYRGRGDAGSIYLTTPDQPDKGDRLYQSDATIWSLTWSPDSKYLLCLDYTQVTVDDKKQYKYRLFVLEAKVGAKASVIYDNRYVSAATWSPDAKTVQFTGYVQGKGQGVLSIPATGGGDPVLTFPVTPGESFTSCLWLPDGKHLVLQRWRTAEKEYQLLLCDPTDRKQDRILARATQSFYYVSLSPDGNYLFYYRRLGQPPKWTLMVLSLRNPGMPHPLGLRAQQLLPPALTADMKHMLLYAGANLMQYDLEGVR